MLYAINRNPTAAREAPSTARGFTPVLETIFPVTIARKKMPRAKGTSESPVPSMDRLKPAGDGSIMSTITAVYLVGTYHNIPLYASLPSPAAYSIVFVISGVAFAVAAILTLTAEEVLGTGKKARKLKIARFPQPNPEKVG